MLEKPLSNQVEVKKEEHIPIAHELACLLEFGDTKAKVKYQEKFFFDFSGWQAFQVAAGLISVYLCKVYLQTIFQETAKDHYKYVRQKLSDILKKKVSEQKSNLFVTNFEILLGDNLLKFPDFYTHHKYVSI